MDGSRDSRARSLEIQKVSELLNKVRDYDAITGLQDRNYVICSSGIRDTTASVVSLVNSGNDMIDKCIMAFSALSIEIDQLVHEARSRYYDALLLYGEEADESYIEREGGSILMMSEFLPFLHELSLFINRSYEVCRNLVLQLFSFSKSLELLNMMIESLFSESHLPKARERILARSWRYLGELLAVLLTLDEIILGNPVLKQHWTAFKKSIQSVNHNPSQFNANDARLKPLQNIITNLELQVLTGHIFQNCCQQYFTSEIQNDKAFMERFQKIINEMLTKWDRLAQEDVPDKQRLIVIVSLTVFYHCLYPILDKKLLKNLAATHKRIAAFHLAGDLLWTPVDFIIHQLPEADKAIDKKIISSVAAAKTAMLDHQAEALSRETKLTEDAIEEWKGEMHETKTQRDFNNNTHQYLSDRCALMLKGARIADKISRLLRCALNGHLVLNRTLTKINAQNIFRLMELIKEIELTFRFFWPSILEWCLHASQYWSGCILRILDGIRSGLSDNSTNIDIVSAILVAESVLSQTPTKTRLLVCGVALEMANYLKNFRTADANEIDDLLTRLDSIANFGAILNRVTDCSFFYWHRNLAKIYFESILDEKMPNKNIEAFMTSLIDLCTLLKSARHCSPEKLIAQFSNEILADFQEFFLKRLCTEIENDLRLAVHSHQHSTNESLENLLFSTKKPANNIQYESDKNVHLVELLKLKTFMFGNEIIDVRKYVSKYLEKTFYELAAVAMHDCETYAKMRILAFHRYDMDLIDSRFPFMTIDQGLDVLSIMYGIPEFVGTYNYDINEQMFIEKNSKSRTLNVVRVDQVVNSIRTHGLGVINTTINLAYQHLKEQFHAFSQFLYDEQIRSQLIKEIRYYRDNIDELNQMPGDRTIDLSIPWIILSNFNIPVWFSNYMYPVKRAERFNNSMSKRPTIDGRSSLEEFRKLITQIGNILGFVRMVRYGAIDSCSYSANFLPTTEWNKSQMIEDAVTNGAGSKEIKEAAHIFDATVNSIYDTFNNTNDYIEMFISVFAKEVRNYEKFSHLRNFFITIPPLTINYIEHILACRSRLGKRTQVDSDFTFVDDGFSMGVGYILTLLNQCYFYESLNWFDSVSVKYEQEIEQIREEQRLAQRRKDESYAQTLTMKISQIEDLQREFQYLMCTVQSALRFFKQKDSEENQEESYLEEF